MFSVYKIILTLFLVAEVVLCNVVINNSMKNYNLTFNLSSKEKFSKRIAAEDNSFMTISCLNSNKNENVPLEGASKELDCTVKIETPKTLWNSKEKNVESHQFKLQSTQSGKESFYITEVLPLYRLDRTRTVVSWLETTKEQDKLKVKFMVVDVNKSTTSPTVTFNAEDPSYYRELRIIVNRDTFTVFATDKDDWTKSACRLTYNFDGQQVGDVDCSDRVFEEFYFTLPGKSHAKLSDSAKNNLMLVDGRMANTAYNVFTQNDRITICERIVDDVNCTQFVDNKVRLNFKRQLPFGTSKIAVYNTPKDEFILLSLDCQTEACETFHFMRIDKSGSIVKSLSVPNYNTKCGFDRIDMVLDVTENKDDICIYSTCSGETTDGASFKCSFNVQCHQKSKLYV